MKYSLAFHGWASLTAEGGSLGTIEIQHDGRQFKVNTNDLLKITLIEIQHKKHKRADQKYTIVSTRARLFVRVLFTHPSGCKGVRLIQCSAPVDQKNVKEMFIQEYLMWKNLSEDTWAVKAAMDEDAVEVVFKDLEEA